jgi:RHS repeat-associated protein
VSQTQLNSDPDGADFVDTTYDPLGRKSTVSNPHRSSTLPTDGVTTYLYDALSRNNLVIPPDGTQWANNVATVYSGNKVTVIDQALTQRRSVTDALGRLVEVDEPTQPTVIGNGTASAIISSTSQICCGAPGTGTVTIYGTEQAYVTGTKPHQTTTYDTGTVSFTVAGVTTNFSYGQHTTASLIASSFAGWVNNTTTLPVTATYSGTVITLTAKTHGTATDYSVSLTSQTNNSSDFDGPSFYGTSAGEAYYGSLTGGANDVTDSGTVWITVAGVQSSTTYGAGSTTSSVASALASLINTNSSSLVTASTSGGTVTVTANASGAAPSFSAGSSSNDSTQFSPPSFTAAASASDLNPYGNTMINPMVTLYTYDALNNLTCVEQHGTATGQTGCSSAPSNDASSAWRIRRFTYDSLSRMVSSSNPESGASTFTYDSDGNMLTKTSPAPNQTGSATVTATLTYDALHRVLTKTFSDGITPSTTIAYDGSTISGCSSSLTSADPVGRRTAMCDAAGWEAWSYDSRGHVITEQRSTNSIVKSTAYTYNFHGAVTSITYPSGRTVTYTYNAVGRTGSASDIANSITYASNAHFTPAGALATLQESGSNLISTFYYDNRLQPCRISVKSSGTAPSSCSDLGNVGNVMDFTYGFNSGSADNGTVASITNNINTARSQTYSYDGLNRVISAQTTSTSGTYSWGFAFTYDPWANLLSATVTQGTGYSFSVYADNSNRIHNTVGAFTYDSAGNLTADPVNPSYTYNAEGELTSAAGVTYTYDGDGNRVQKSNGKLYWYGNSTDPLAESDASGNLTNEYIFLSGARIATLTLSAGTVNYYVSDHLGSSHVVTNSSGTILDDSDFYPYGGERSYSSSSGNTRKFTGKERDNESGLDDFAARFYTSNYGRFLSADDTKYVNTTDPQTWNLYGYVANNPINSVDPTGHAPESEMPHVALPMETNGGPTDAYGETAALEGRGPGSLGNVVEDDGQNNQQQAQKLQVTITKADPDAWVDRKLGDKYFTGFGVLITITFLDANGKPVVGADVTEHNEGTENGRAIDQRVTPAPTGKDGTISDCVCIGHRDSDPNFGKNHGATKDVIRDDINHVSEVTSVIKQTLTLKTGKDTYSITYTRTLTNVGANGNLNAVNPKTGWNLNLDTTKPSITKQ